MDEEYGKEPELYSPSGSRTHYRLLLRWEGGMAILTTAGFDLLDVAFAVIVSCPDELAAQRCGSLGCECGCEL